MLVMLVLTVGGCDEGCEDSDARQEGCDQMEVHGFQVEMNSVRFVEEV